MAEAMLFDRIMGSMKNRPDVTWVPPATRRSMALMDTHTQTFNVQTCREKERGDTIFLEYTSAEGFIRIALPPEVATAIASQRDALTKRTRRAAGKAQAAARKAAGIEPAFLRMRQLRSKQKKKKPKREPS